MIYVFKTNITNKKSVNYLKPFLDEISEIKKWNFDLEDCDNILRIDGKKNISDQIIMLIKAHNYSCIELF